MGAPKQKWTPEEETALKSGVIKHGPGKWRTILLDPEFTSALQSRSNVDLKDKWRNISVTAIWGSRQKARLGLKRTPKRGDDNSTALTIVAMANGVDGRRRNGRASPPVEPPRDFKGLFTSVDKVILEAITNSDRPLGLDGKSIVLYAEENCKMQPNMKRLVNSRLKHLINVGTLVKTKLKYSIAPNYAAAVANQSSPLLEGNKENTPKPEDNGVQVDGGLLMIQGMTAQEAAVAAARAVAEAEFARAEAEHAAREADEAEAQAEAAHIFAKVAMKALRQSQQSQTRK